MFAALKWLVTFVVSLLFSTCVLDFYVKFSDTVPPVISYYHPELGLFSRPNLRWSKFKEGFYIGESYSNSRFGENHPKKKPADTFRIALIGDSFVEGLDVLSRHHFQRTMKRDLEDHFGGEFQILNFGRGNSTLPFSYYHLQHYILDYDPDLVLVFLEERDRNPPVWTGRTRYELKQGALDPVLDWRETGQYKLIQRLEKIPLVRHYIDVSLVALANRALANIRTHSLGSVLLDKFQPFFLPGSKPRPQPDRSRIPVSDLIGRILTELTELGRRGDPDVVFVLRPLPPAPELEPFLMDIDADYWNLSELFVGGNTDVLASSGINSRYWKATGVVGGHWNHAGHREVGHFLAGKVIERLEEADD